MCGVSGIVLVAMDVVGRSFIVVFSEGRSPHALELAAETAVAVADIDDDGIPAADVDVDGRSLVWRWVIDELGEDSLLEPADGEAVADVVVAVVAAPSDDRPPRDRFFSPHIGSKCFSFHGSSLNFSFSASDLSLS